MHFIQPLPFYSFCCVNQADKNKKIVNKCKINSFQVMTLSYQPDGRKTTFAAPVFCIAADDNPYGFFPSFLYFYVLIILIIKSILL